MGRWNVDRILQGQLQRRSIRCATIVYGYILAMSEIIDAMALFDDIDANERWMLQQLRDHAMTMPTAKETMQDVLDRNNPDGE